MRDVSAEGDSHERYGGRIPGTPGLAAYSLCGPVDPTVPILLAVPHAGRAYPKSLLREMRMADTAVLKLEDRYVDRLARAASQATGASLLIANAPRAMIDLNRAPDDVDWTMFKVGDRPHAPDQKTGRRARSGLGVIPRRVPGIGELWKRPHERAELSDRIAEIHEPYHLALSRRLADLRERWGASILLDLHSMPPINPQAPSLAARFVVGDRFGASCHGSLVATAFSCFAEQGLPVAHNRPYAGGYVLERHGAPDADIHAMQLEIDRSAYLDSRFAEPGPGFDQVVSLLADLILRLATQTTRLGEGGGDARWPEAAE